MARMLLLGSLALLAAVSCAVELSESFRVRVGPPGPCEATGGRSGHLSTGGRP